MQWALSFIFTISLLLSLASSLMWVRSYWIGDAWSVATHSSLFSANVCRGRMWVGFRVSRQGPSFHHAAIRPPYTILRPAGMLGRLGFFYDDRRSASGGARLSLVFPIWLAVIVTALPSGGKLVVLFRQRRRRVGGRCPNCGYDLRATPGRCPECGAGHLAKGRSPVVPA